MRHKLQRQLEVRYRIRRNHELETEQPRQQVFGYIALPHASVVAVNELLANVINDRIQECSGAGSWIKHKNLVALGGLANFVFLASDAETRIDVFYRDLSLVSQPFWTAEISLQNLID